MEIIIGLMVFMLCVWLLAALWLFFVLMWLADEMLKVFQCLLDAKINALFGEKK